MTNKKLQDQQTNNDIVVMGGGTGTFPVIAALSHCQANVTAIIAVSDSGGSGGRIRDEFGFQPVGDLRQSLAALADSDSQAWIRNLLLYRFAKGDGLKGHNLGNLILTALQDMTGDTDMALEIAAKIFRLEGKVIPVTKDNVHIEIHYKTGEVRVGEHILDEETDNPPTIDHIKLIPKATLNPKAAAAIVNAQAIIIGPGDYYSSLLVTLLPDGIKHAFAQTKAKIIYIGNLMTRATQTKGMTAADHVQGIETAIGRSVDHILLNNQSIPTQVLTHYAKQDEHPVVDDLVHDVRTIHSNLLLDQTMQQNQADAVSRSLLRHDSQKLKLALQKILAC